MKRWEFYLYLGTWVFILFGLYAGWQNHKRHAEYHRQCDALKELDQ